MMNNHMSVEGVMRRIVPITRFNKGEANKIFDEVNLTGPKVVLKNNDPVCVLINPQQYEAMVEALIDYELAAEAERRLAEGGPTYTMDEVLNDLGISEADLEDVEVEIE